MPGSPKTVLGRRRSRPQPDALAAWLGVSLAAGAVAYRLTGRAGGQALRLSRAVLIDRPQEELYGFLREPANVARFSNRVRSVESLDGRRSRWQLEAPGGGVATWEAELVEERSPERLVWRPAGGEGEARLSVTLRRAASGRGVEVRAEAELGSALSRGVGEAPARQLGEDLRRLKQLTETGEIATTAGQPSGRRSPLGRLLSGSDERRPAA